MSDRVNQDEKDMLTGQQYCNYPRCNCPFDLHSNEKCMLGRPRVGYGATDILTAGGLFGVTTLMYNPDEVQITGPAPLALNVKRLRPDAQLPTYAHDNDACFDLTTTESGYLPPHQMGVFGTGLAFEVPVGYVLLIFSRSGMGFKQGVRLVNSVAVIDPGYHKEVMVGLRNDSTLTHTVTAGDRIAQAMLIPRPKVAVKEVPEFTGEGRASAGFGGSGQ